jgi:hypothetical protein
MRGIIIRVSDLQAREIFALRCVAAAAARQLVSLGACACRQERGAAALHRGRRARRRGGLRPAAARIVAAD